MKCEVKSKKKGKEWVRCNKKATHKAIRNDDGLVIYCCKEDAIFYDELHLPMHKFKNYNVEVLKV